MNREQWLNECMDRLRPDFDMIGTPLPDKIRCSCSWPSKSALSSKKRRIGECWSSDCSEDRHVEIFISPYLKDSVYVAGTLVHELVHATVGVDKKHGKVFRKAANAIGLEGKMTSTEAGEQLKTRLRQIVEEIGEYPHATLDKAASNATPKQSTRMLKVKCTNPECECIIRMTNKWMEEVGCPTCACGSPMEPEKKDGEDSEDGE